MATVMPDATRMEFRAQVPGQLSPTDRSVFTLFSMDEETFTNGQLWKNLLRHTSTELLWERIRDGHGVRVWGNVPYMVGKPDTVRSTNKAYVMLAGGGDHGHRNPYTSRGAR
jgi:hypothetical protein